MAKLHPQFRLVLPLDTKPHEAWMHARARLFGKSLAKTFSILAVKPQQSGTFSTKEGIVEGRLYVVILTPNDPDAALGEQVVYEHPDYEKLVH